ncbi:hypothetical protein EDWATA_03298 [Edwardsiella tarda ATCC 23685]|uniref:Uncharacterized protein n=1 Tax=Edwardsiella tarda ATCC 23685 TaxID=500638 RepID=D4F943_EDWTA|nr:hypothetical protein EDWATA_03298 [Edwardsiella tarda ATCC 23685]
MKPLLRNLILQRRSAYRNMQKMKRPLRSSGAVPGGRKPPYIIL